MIPCPHCMSTMELDANMVHRCENPNCSQMIPTLHTLWRVSASANPRAVWRLVAIEGDQYTLRLVRLDPVNFNRAELGETMRVDLAWFARRGVRVEL